MFFIPLSQVESVELVIHALKTAAGEADCSQCPVRKVCMKQCLNIATSIEGMVTSGALPNIDPDESIHDSLPIEEETTKEPKSSPKPFLRVIK